MSGLLNRFKNPRFLVTTGGSALLATAVLSLFGFDQIVKIGVRDQTALRKRNEVRDIYLKLPFPLDFRIYFFNVTNPTEIETLGAKPILRQIGPFVYDEFKEKVDIVDNQGEDSLTYTQFDTFIFNPNKSGTLRDTDSVTIINPLIVGMGNLVYRDTPALLSIINKAIPKLFDNPTSIFTTVRVKDILFDGIPISCRSKDFATTAVCAQVKTLIPDLLRVGKSKTEFFFLGSRNATLGKRFKVSRGIQKSKELGRLLEVQGETSLSIWKTQFCNRYHGTDGWIFPPMLPKEEGIWSYSTDVCRSIKAVYIEEKVYKKIHVRKYHATLGDQQTNEEDKCYCPDKGCLKKGVFDLSKCMGVPIFATLPHFLEADPSYLDKVEGLNPVVDDHIIRIHFEPLTGTPLEAKKRLQFNLLLQPIIKIDLLRKVPTVMMPIFWVEESVEIEGALLTKVQVIFMLLKGVRGTLYAGMAGGGGLLGLAGYMYYKNRQTVSITPAGTERQSQSHSANKSERSLVKETIEDVEKNQGVDNPGLELEKY